MVTSLKIRDLKYFALRESAVPAEDVPLDENGRLVRFGVVRPGCSLWLAQ